MLQNIKWRLLSMWFCECKVIILSRTLLVYLLVVRLLRLFWCLPLIPLTFSPNPPPPAALAASPPSCCSSWEHLPGRDKSSVWDQLEDAAMETFSLSRANFHAFALFSVCVPARVCFSYKLSTGLLFDLTQLWEIRSCFFLSEGETRTSL